MTFLDLKKKLLQLLEAKKMQSDILKTDETALQKILFDVKREFYQLNSMVEKKEELEKAKNTLASKYNDLDPEDRKIYESLTLTLDNKVCQLKKICIQKAEIISALHDTIKELAALDEKMADSEFVKKTSLFPMWKEVKEIYGVEDLQDELELEIYESVISTIDSKQENNELELLIKELKQEVSQEDTEKSEKSNFLGKIFSRKKD